MICLFMNQALPILLGGMRLGDGYILPQIYRQLWRRLMRYLLRSAHQRVVVTVMLICRLFMRWPVNWPPVYRDILLLSPNRRCRLVRAGKSQKLLPQQIRKQILTWHQTRNFYVKGRPLPILCGLTGWLSGLKPMRRGMSYARSTARYI